MNLGRSGAHQTSDSIVAQPVNGRGRRKPEAPEAESKQATAFRMEATPGTLLGTSVA